jgi:hypothetical protein
VEHKPANEWKHTTAKDAYNDPVGVDFFDDEQDGFVSIYLRDANGKRFPARTVDMSKKEHAKEVLLAWMERGPLHDYRRPEPGDLYVFEVGDITLEWLILRVHPDHKDTFCVVPLHDSSFLGSIDVCLMETTLRPLIAACGQSDWFPLNLFENSFKVGKLPTPALLSIRKRLAEIVRGTLNVVAESRLETDLDPHYEELMEDIAAARQILHKKGDSV